MLKEPSLHYLLIQYFMRSPRLLIAAAGIKKTMTPSVFGPATQTQKPRARTSAYVIR